MVNRNKFQFCPEMETMIAYCGLICDNCPIHLSTMEPDKSIQHAMRESIADECAKLYMMNIKPGDITDCDGCQANGRLFTGCLTCEVRKCASQKNIISCAYCSDYACGQLKKFFSDAPEARTQLEEIRKSYNQQKYPELR